MAQLTALIAAICIHTSHIETKEQKIGCIDHYTNCILNGNKPGKCQDKEPKWIRKKTQN